MKISFLKSSSVLLCIFLSLPVTEGFAAVRQKKFRDIYLERRLANTLNNREKERFEKEYNKFEKEFSKDTKEDWNKNLKNFVNETKKHEK